MTLPRPTRAVVGTTLLALALTPRSGAADDPRPELRLTLDEAIERALHKNESIFVVRESLDSAEAAVDGSRGAWDPLLEIEGGWRHATLPVNSAFSGAPAGALAPTIEATTARAGVRQLLPTGGEVDFRTGASRTTTDGEFSLLSPAHDTNVGVEIRQPLLRDRKIDAARRTLRVASADRNGAEASLRIQVANTLAGVEAAYWSFVSTLEEVHVREDTVELAQRQLAETRIRIEQGQSPETEIAQPRAELERRRGELLASREAVSRADNRLKILILGDDEPELWQSRLVPIEDATIESEPVDPVAAMDRALASRPELALVRSNVERSGIESAYAEDGVRPALDLVASYDRFGLTGSANPAAAPLPGLPVDVPPRLRGGLGSSFGDLGNGDFDDARIGLVLSIPIRNRSARAAAAMARSAERQAAADETRTRKLIRAEVLDAAAAVDTARQRIEAARAAREAAEVQLDAEQQRFAAGLTTNFLVLTRQTDLEHARLDEIGARTDYRIARTELARATGGLLEARGVELE